MFAFLGKILPFLTPVLDKLAGRKSSRVAEMEAEQELLETKAFLRGRYSPKYMLKYTMVGVIWIFIGLFVAHVMFPEQFPDPLSWLPMLVAHVTDLLAVDWKGF